MRKCGKFLLLAILAIVLIATLVACNQNEAGQNGGSTTTPGGNTGGGDTTVVEPVPSGLFFKVLKGASTFDKVAVSDFDVTRDIEAYILLRAGNAAPVISDKITMTEDMIVAEDRAKLDSAYDGPINVEYDHEGKTLKGTFIIHLKNDSLPLVPVKIVLKDGASLSGGGATSGADNVWTVSADPGVSYTFEEFVSAYKVIAPKGEALSHYTYGEEQTVFGAGDTLTVTEGMTLTAVFSSSLVEVNFVLQAPADCWEEGTQVSDPAPVYVAANGVVPRPEAQAYSSDKYTLIGWSLDPDGNELWNFSKRLSAQTGERNSLTLYAKWVVKSATVTLSLPIGSFVDSATGIALSPTDGLKPAVFAGTYDEEGKIDSFVVGGIAYGDMLKDYYVEFSLNELDNPVKVALEDLGKLLTRSSVYSCEGIYLDKTYQTSAFDVPVSETRLTLYVGWKFVGGEDLPDDYFEENYSFVLKPDNTYMVTSAASDTGVIYIPATFNGKPVTEIAANAFGTVSKPTGVDFSDAVNLEKIGDRAFYTRTSIVTLSGTESLEKLVYVGEDAFYGTAWFNNSRDAAGNEDIVLGNVLILYRGAQRDGDLNLSSVTAYDYIGYGAFGGCDFTSVILPAGIKGIEDNAFENNAQLAGVTSSATGIEYISANAFAGSLLDQPASDVIIGNVFFRAAESSTGTVNVPDVVTVIAERAFSGLRNVTEVAFVNEGAITSVGKHAFRNTAWANGAEDGFVIVNGILVAYYGSATTVVVPDEVNSLGSYAFSGRVENVVFRSTSLLSAIQAGAFAEAAYLKKIGIYNLTADSTLLSELNIDDDAFANAAGTALAGDNFVLYVRSDAMGDTSSSAALSYLRTKVANSTANAPTLNGSVFAADYVATDEDFGVADFAAAWGVTLNEGDKSILVRDGITINRDGIVFAEDYAVPVSDIETSISGLTVSGSEKHTLNGSGKLMFEGIGIPYNYSIHAALDIALFALDDTYKQEGDTLVFYTTQKSFDTSGTLLYGYMALTAGSKNIPGTSSDEAPSEAPLSGEGITVTGYRADAGVYTDGLTVTYDYFGVPYTQDFTFEVRRPKANALRQTSTTVLPLGSAAGAAELRSVTFDVIYDDGAVEHRTLNNATILRVDGVLRDTLDTSTLGIHVAHISYSAGSGSLPLETDIVYSVELTAITSLYEFAYNDEDDTATITRATGNRAFYVLPETVKHDGKTYNVTAIGDGAFAGNTALTTVYFAKNITTIGDDAFRGCTQLKDLFGFTDDSGQAPLSVADGGYLILSEHREGTVKVPVVGVSDYALGLDTLTLPEKVSYDGVMTLDQMNETERARYDKGATVTVTYTMDFAFDEAAVNALVGFGGTLRLPQDADGNVIDAYQEIYDARVAAGSACELYEAAVVGPEAIIGIFTIGDEGSTTPEYTSRTGSIRLTEALSDEAFEAGGVVVVPATVSGEGNATYTVTEFAERVLSKFKDAEAVYIPHGVIGLPEGGIEAVFGNAEGDDAITAQVFVYTKTDVLTRPYSHYTGGVEPFPARVEVIGDYAFANCAQLTVDLSTATAVKSIGKGAFSGCTGITEFAPGEGSQLEWIGDFAFANSLLQSVDLSKTKVTDIDAGAFSGCVQLASFTFSAQVKNIGVNAFDGCAALADSGITIQNGTAIAYIGDFAFRGTSVTAKVFDGHLAMVTNGEGVQVPVDISGAFQS